MGLEAVSYTHLDVYKRQDVWEKYAVDRIETTETLYKEVVSETEKPIDIEDLFTHAEVIPTTRVNPFNGTILSLSLIHI